MSNNEVNETINRLKTLSTVTRMAPVAIYNLVVLIILYINSCYGSNLKKDTGEVDMSICKEKACVPKCCQEDEYVFKMSCVKYKKNKVALDFEDMPVYDEKRTKIISTVKKSLRLLSTGKFSNATYRSSVVNIARGRDVNWYLTEKGNLYMESPNSYTRWEAMDDFCVDHVVYYKNKRSITYAWVVEPIVQTHSTNIYITSGIIISCAFLLVVLIVYAVLPELRNLCGLILMAYVFSLFWAFLLLAVINFRRFSTTYCLGLTFSIYYFFLAAFCWMNIMSYDIWWTFRGYAKARPIHRRGEHFKFLMYCLYAFGLPLAMTIGLIVMNSIDLKHMPWIVTPNIPRHGCFIYGGEKFLYLYIPMLILILSNWIFYLMTAFNVWRLSRGTAVLDSAAAGNPAAHRTQWNRFMVYLKLSVVMGLNWVFEVVSFLDPDTYLWYITDAYNILIGLAIFFIFVCKKKILRKLIKRFNTKSKKRSQNGFTPSISLSSISNSGSQETTMPFICTNPNGPGLKEKI